jgi:CheY-like chemotaxis protein
LSSTASDVNIRILVINDEPDILLAMSSILSARGYYVKIFDKAAAALEHLASKTAQYDLVITDYRMPSGISPRFGKVNQERCKKNKSLSNDRF